MLILISDDAVDDYDDDYDDDYSYDNHDNHANADNDASCYNYNAGRC